MTDSVQDSILSLAVQLSSRYPVAGAQAIETRTPEHALAVLEAMPPHNLEAILPQLSASFLASIVASGEPRRIASLLKAGGPEVCASVLLELAESSRAQFLYSLPDDLQERLREYLDFPERSAGRAMRTDCAAFDESLTVRDVVVRLRQRPKSQRHRLTNVFVLDDQLRLVGVVPMRELLLASDEEILGSLMTRNVISVSSFDDAAAASRIMSTRGFTSLPVIDSQGRLTGVLRAAQLLVGAQNSAAEDIQKLFGVGSSERAFSPVRFCLGKRLPWLHVNLVTALLAASVVGLFEDLIARVTILAVYLPVVAGQSGNAGAQSLAVVMRGLVMREIPQDRVLALLRKETLIGLVNGCVVGTVTALVAWLWNGNPYLGLVVGLAMIVNLTAAGLSGASIPLIMRRFGLDPAQSSSIVLTTVTDIVGFFAFLGFAVVFESQLL